VIGGRSTSLLGVAAAVLGALALGAAAACADGDPASDVLLYQPAYLPLSLSTSPRAADLKRVLDEAHRAGQPIKLAVIAERKDLGREPQYFGRPQKYARFLAGELSAYNLVVRHGHFGRDPLLVVMPAGFGTHGFSPASAAGLRSIRVGGPGPDDLAEAAGRAVQSLAAANGHPIRAVFPRRAADHSHALLWALVIGALAAGCAAAAFITRRGGRGREP
jgi:hypothetical protein